MLDLPSQGPINGQTQRFHFPFEGLGRCQFHGYLSHHPAPALPLRLTPSSPEFLPSYDVSSVNWERIRMTFGILSSNAHFLPHDSQDVNLAMEQNTSFLKDSHFSAVNSLS